MTEFFVWSNSFAAPFFSDSDTRFVQAESAAAALDKARAEYRHPAGLFAMNVYASADAYHKKADALATYRHPLAEATSSGIACPTCKQNADFRSSMPDGEMAFYCKNGHRTEKHRKDFM